MARGRGVSILMVLSLLSQALCVPAGLRLRRGYVDNELDSKENGPTLRDLVAAESNRQTREDHTSGVISLENETDAPVKVSDDDDDDDDDDFAEPMQTSPTTGGSGSNIFSILNLVNAFFPASGASSVLLKKLIREYLLAYQARNVIRRQDVGVNEIEIDYVSGLKPPPLQKQEIDENGSNNSDSDDTEDDNSNGDDENDENNAGEESVENDDKGNNGNDNASKSKADADDNDKDDDDDDKDDDSDYDDEPPGGGDGQGGGILGLLAGLSGGENGESDLGSLLAAISGIVVNLSGDGVDINAIIASGLGLFVGLLSEGEQNPGEILASYLLTSLDTITGGGSKNNGKFFGKFLSTLITGSSAGEDQEGDSDENGNGNRMKDSAGFFASLLMGLLGEMSKGSSGGSSSHTW